MKINAIVNLLKNTKTKNKVLTMHIREMIPKIQELNVTLDIVNNNLKTMINLITEDDIQTMLQIVIQIQHLHKCENIDEYLLIMLEKYTSGYHTQMLQILQQITQKADIFNLAYTYRFLRICYRIKLQSNNKPITMSAQALSDSVIEQVGKSCKNYLFGSEEAKQNLPALLMFFFRIADGTLDSDFDEGFAFRTLQILFEEFSKLLLLLNPKIAGLIKSNLSAQIKSQLNKQTQPISKLQSIFKIIEILLLGNAEYFSDFLGTIKKYLFTEEHSIQKQLAYQTLVNCASIFAEFLQEDNFKQEMQNIYSDLIKQTDIENINVPHKLQQIHEVVGHFVPLDNLYLVYSDNRQILYFIAEFNNKLSQHLINPSIVQQKLIKKCMKNLLQKVEFIKLEQTYIKLCQIFDKDIRNSMIIHLIKNQQINFVIKIIPELQDISHQVWQNLIDIYIKDQEEQIRQFLLNYGLSETLLFSLYQSQCYQLILQICNKNFSQLKFEELINFLFGEIENQHAVELICSLIILDLQRSGNFKFDLMLKLIQSQKHNELLLHYIQTIQQSIGVDLLLSLLSQCQPIEFVITILQDCILNQDICESDLDLILFIIEKQEQLNDEFIIQLMQKFIDSPEYAMALFNRLCKKNIPIKLIFYLAREISSQKYFNSEISKQFEFQHQKNTDYLFELCKFTHEIAIIDIDFLINQITFLQEVLLTQQYDLVEEVTRMFVFYVKNCPKCLELTKLFTEYEFLYAHGSQELTKLLLQIHQDIEGLLVFYNIENGLLNKLQHLFEYAEFAEYQQQKN